MALRKFCGGYHAKNLRICLVCSSLLLLLCILFSLVAACDRKLLAVTILAGVSLVICSPLDHENRVLNPDEKICYKKITAVLTAVFLSAGALFYMKEMPVYAVSIFTGIILSAGMQMPVADFGALFFLCMEDYKNDQKCMKNIVWRKWG